MSRSSRASRSPLPERPRLAEHVLPRLHVAGARELVILHDTREGRLVQIGRREWGLLAAADGTRDIEGIVLAAARSGSFAKAAALQGFLEQLHAAGMIEEGPAGESLADPPPVVPADRPLDPLAGYLLRCDGSGSCCRLYASVLFSPVEVARARALLPSVLDAGDRRSNAFSPERGSGPCAASAVAQVDGRCAYLADGGLCSLHAAGGEGGKPLGCRLFPATFTDDGEAVRVSVAVECACVLASARGGSGGARRAFAFASTSPLRAADVRPWVEALRRRAARRVEEDAAWRSERDLARRAVRWIEGAAAILLDPGACEAAIRGCAEEDRALEAFYARALVHGHQLVVSGGEGLPLAHALRDRAVRLLVARALPAAIARASSEEPGVAPDPAERYPLALVEAMLRGHGLESYRRDIEGA